MQTPLELIFTVDRNTYLKFLEQFQQTRAKRKFLNVTDLICLSRPQLLMLMQQGLMMSLTSDSQPDRLLALPPDIRKRIYFFCGFPIGREWYHSCESRIVSA